jgi:hypothetical protein
MKQLRDRNEPIRLFGESDEARLKRLQYIKTHESEEVGSEFPFNCFIIALLGSV